MKREKEDDKVTSPMFPRLHVNEREKGGPRAPPRNKMALYEHLSIPSQRFNSELNSNNHSTFSATSSSQISGNKRPMFSPYHFPRSTPQADNSNTTSSDSRPSFAEPRKRVDEEDFAVPVFVQSENDQNSKHSDIMDQDIMSHSRPAQINSSSRNQSACNKEQEPNSITVSNLRKKYRINTQELQYPPDDLANDVDELHGSNDTLNHEVIDGPLLQNVQNTSSKGENYKEKKTKHSLGIQSANRCDNDSDTSIVESILGVCITPDEVVGEIGEKHFWKLRRTMVNQQRVFAVQVFELHRLIKVQKSFAGSPNILYEDTSSIGKTLKTSIPEQLQLDIIVEPPPKPDKLKENHHDKPSQKATTSAEKTMGKSSISSSQNVPQSTPVTSDPSRNPWHFNQPTGHHWLVPVMSPTEGLIYKPYGGPDHTGSNPIINNFSNPLPYGMIPNSHPFFHGMVIPPNISSMTHHGYFPPHGMPYMGPAISGSVVDQGSHFNEQQQYSRNGPTQMNIQNFGETQMGKEMDLQVSTSTSPGEDDEMANENLIRAIKVVPYNAVSVNESAFRIFQSIQKEREQHDEENAW